LTKNKIALLLAYFGEWPIWLPAFLASCKRNTGVDWIIFTDCDIPDPEIDNVRFVSFSMREFNKLASNKLGLPFSHKNPYKLCDFKPCYGVIFSDYLNDYEFWGHCDMDVVWGDIRKFISDPVLEQHDIISARKNAICGHFNLYRNKPGINNLFKAHPHYTSILLNDQHCYFDENHMTQLIAHMKLQSGLRVYWPDYVLDQEFVFVLRKYPSGWLWQDGHLYNENVGHKEVMYIHFLEWKKTILEMDFTLENAPNSFMITSKGITSAD